MSDELVGTCDWLVAEIYRSHLLDRGRLDAVVAEFARDHTYADARALAAHLVDQKILSAFQSERVLDGEARSLVMGPYVLCEPVGTGGLGTVYRAVGKADRQAYAVKVLPMRGVWNVRLARVQVRRFAELPANPTVVPFMDVGTAGGKHYLVWPFVTGTPLDVRVGQQGPLTPLEAARIALQAAEGLDLAHRHGVFHGLIKPSNIMLDPDGSVHLLDFGVGALLAENTDESLLDTMSTANATAGMLDCASPESLLDPAKRSFAGDQYSLGCVMYFCLAGRYPFPDGTMIEKMTAHQTQAPTPLAALCPYAPPDLAAIVGRLMHKKPDARYGDMAEVAAELMVVLSQSRSTSRPPTPPEPPAMASLEDTPGVRRSARTDPAVLPPPTLRPAKIQPLLPAPTPPPKTLPRTTEPEDEPPSPAAPPRPKPVRAEPAGRSRLSRALGALAFWRPRSDIVSCSVLAPPLLTPGESATLPLFAHSEPTDTILVIGRTYFPTHELVATTMIRRDLVRGARVTFHVALPGMSLEPPAHKFVWRGQVMPLPFTLVVPVDFRPGEVVGVVSIADGADVVCNCEFPIVIQPNG